MSFDFADRPSVWIPVKWMMLKPPQRNAKDKRTDNPLAVEEEQRIDLHVELLDREELTDLFGDFVGVDRDDGEVRSGDISHEASQALALELDLADGKIKTAEEFEPRQLTRREVELLRFMRVVKDWARVKDGAASVPFSSLMARRMLAVAGFVSAFEAEYLSACAGKADTRRKN